MHSTPESDSMHSKDAHYRQYDRLTMKVLMQLVGPAGSPMPGNVDNIILDFLNSDQ